MKPYVEKRSYLGNLTEKPGNLTSLIPFDMENNITIQISKMIN